jgi:hypothetical protein
MANQHIFLYFQFTLQQRLLNESTVIHDHIWISRDITSNVSEESVPWLQPTASFIPTSSSLVMGIGSQVTLVKLPRKIHGSLKWVEVS